jgi:hypothetical protein
MRRADAGTIDLTTIDGLECVVVRGDAGLPASPSGARRYATDTWNSDPSDLPA